MKTFSLSKPLLGHPLPPYALDILASQPQRGGGLNNWLYRAALVLHPYRAEDEIRAVLENAAATCGGPVQRDEISRAITNSKDHAWQPGAASHCPAASASELRVRQFKKDPAAIKRIFAASGGFGLVDLCERSPIRLLDAESGSHCEDIIDALFPGNPLLCVGLCKQRFDTRSRAEWRGKLAENQLIVPSPMSKPTGERKDGGGQSAHTLDNTGPRRFLVIEFDTGSFDDHAALLWHLARRAPLALAVHSGSKSLHGWFYCAGQPVKVLRRFMSRAIRLGADPATWTRSQFVRLPEGQRDNGKTQHVFYFNPAVLPHAQPEPSHE